MQYQEIAKKLALKQMHGFDFGEKRINKIVEFSERDRALDDKINKYLIDSENLEVERESMRIQALAFLENFNEDDFNNFTPELQNEVLKALKNHRYEMVSSITHENPEDFSKAQLNSFLEYVTMKDKVTKKVLHHHQGGNRITTGSFVSDPNKRFILIEGTNAGKKVTSGDDQTFDEKDDVKFNEVVDVEDDIEDEFVSMESGDGDIEVELDDESAKNLVRLFHVDPEDEVVYSDVEGTLIEKRVSDDISILPDLKKTKTSHVSSESNVEYQLNNQEFDVSSHVEPVYSPTSSSPHDDVEIFTSLNDPSHFSKQYTSIQTELQPYDEIISLEDEPPVQLIPFSRVERYPENQDIRDDKPTPNNPFRNETKCFGEIISSEDKPTGRTRLNQNSEYQNVQSFQKEDNIIYPFDYGHNPVEQQHEESKVDNEGLPPMIPDNPQIDDDSNVETFGDEEYLEGEANKHQKRSATVSKSLIEDTKQLLNLLGIPYVTAPYEADAQCAYYNSNGFVDYVITEDSDVFLFGGLSICRNIFSRDEHDHPEIYTNENIASILGLDRSKLLQLGYLLGGDYTEGVRNCGIVNAVECVAYFHNKEEDIKKNTINSLEDFAKWVRDLSKPEKGSFEEKHFKQKVKFSLPTDFPDDRIVDAYLYPQVNENPPNFKWNDLNMTDLYEFTQDHMGLSPQETDQIIKPALENRDNSQTHIQSFFFQDTVGEIKSTRLKKAISKMEKNV